MVPGPELYYSGLVHLGVSNLTVDSVTVPVRMSRVSLEARR
jgi:hypothetical protein